MDTEKPSVNPQWKVVAIVAVVLAVAGAAGTIGLTQRSGASFPIILTHALGVTIPVMAIPALLAWWRRDHAPAVFAIGSAAFLAMAVWGASSIGGNVLQLPSGSVASRPQATAVPQPQPRAESAARVFNPATAVPVSVKALADARAAPSQPVVADTFDVELANFRQRGDTQAVLAERSSSLMLDANLQIVHQQRPDWTPEDKLNEAYNRTVAAIDAREIAKWDADLREFARYNCSLVHARNAPLFSEVMKQVALPGMTNQQLFEASRDTTIHSSGYVPVQCQ